MGMIGENPSIQMSCLGSIFLSEEYKSMRLEALWECQLTSVETAYEDPWEQTSMGFMDSGEGFNDGNDSHWADQKRPSFPRSTY